MTPTASTYRLEIPHRYFSHECAISEVLLDHFLITSVLFHKMLFTLSQSWRKLVSMILQESAMRLEKYLMATKLRFISFSLTDSKFQWRSFWPFQVTLCCRLEIDQIYTQFISSLSLSCSCFHYRSVNWVKICIPLTLLLNVQSLGDTQNENFRDNSQIMDNIEKISW